MADENKQTEEGAEAPKSSTSTAKIVIIAVLASVILSAGIGGGAFYFMGGMDPAPEATAEGEDSEVEKEEPPKPPQYFSLDPKFVVSFSDQRKARFMQFSLQLMTRENDVMKDIEAHMPAIRSSLLMLFGVQKYDEMVSIEGKQKLLLATVTDVNQTLTKMTGSKEPVTGVEAAYFDSFVIQ